VTLQQQILNRPMKIGREKSPTSARRGTGSTQSPAVSIILAMLVTNILNAAAAAAADNCRVSSS